MCEACGSDLNAKKEEINQELIFMRARRRGVIPQWACLGLLAVVLQQCAVAQEGEVSDAFSKTPGVYFGESTTTHTGVSLKGCEAKCAAGDKCHGTATVLAQRSPWNSVDVIPRRALTLTLSSQMLGASPSALRMLRLRTARRTVLRREGGCRRSASFRRRSSTTTTSGKRSRKWQVASPVSERVSCQRSDPGRLFRFHREVAHVCRCDLQE